MDVEFKHTGNKNADDPLSLTQVLRLGSNIQFLTDAAQYSDQVLVGSEDGSGILNSLTNIEYTLANSDLESPVVAEVANFRTEIQSEYDPQEILNDSDAESLHLKSSTWLDLLEEALKREKRIPASKTGILDAGLLVEAPDQLLSPAIWRWLDERPKSDLREACKSMAVGCPTACVMLSLRAVEHTLRRWHEQKQGTIETQAWGGVLDQLMSEYSDESKQNDTVFTQLSDLPPVLSNLYYLKEKRNEVGHPDRSPDEMEARRTLMIVAATITEIYDEMMENRIDELELDKDSIDTAESVDQIIYDILVRIQEKTDATGAPKESVIRKGLELGFTEAEIENAFQDLLMSGKIYESGKDTLCAI